MIEKVQDTQNLISSYMQTDDDITDDVANSCNSSFMWSALKLRKDSMFGRNRRRITKLGETIELPSSSSPSHTTPTSPIVSSHSKETSTTVEANLVDSDNDKSGVNIDDHSASLNSEGDDVSFMSVEEGLNGADEEFTSPLSSPPGKSTSSEASVVVNTQRDSSSMTHPSAPQRTYPRTPTDEEYTKVNSSELLHHLLSTYSTRAKEIRQRSSNDHSIDSISGRSIVMMDPMAQQHGCRTFEAAIQGVGTVLH